MLKVVIADDEERIVRLIQALIDWESLGLQVVATAFNGYDAASQVVAHNPDILITDIRMPGCDGLELIRQVKGTRSDLEIIIISGYAHFPYAQAAMQYGVADYLLKPINKNDLTQTLLKLKEKIMDRQLSRQDVAQLLVNDQQTKERLRSHLALDLLSHGAITQETLIRQYDFSMLGGLYQTFCLKLDCETVRKEAVQVAIEKAYAIFTANLKPICRDFILNDSEYAVYGIVQMEPKMQGDMKRRLRDCLNQLVSQKSIFGGIVFTLALGFATADAEQLHLSMANSQDTVAERIVAGTERLLDTLPQGRGLDGTFWMENYTRQITHAIQTFDRAESDSAVYELEKALEKKTNVRGYEVLQLVESACTVFVAQTDRGEKVEVIQTFQQSCGHCGSVKELFAKLANFQLEIIQSMEEAHNNEALRPIRLAKQYIQNHYNEPITLEQVSEIVGLSPTYFSVLFKKETGEGFAKYIIALRIEKAKTLLRESNLSVAAICKEVGYNDSKHFNQTFEKACQVKPSVYRKLYG